MVNEPMPYQLTVGQLKTILHDVPDETVVALVVPPSFWVDSRLTLLYNIEVSYTGGPVLRVLPVESPPNSGRSASHR